MYVSTVIPINVMHILIQSEDWTSVGNDGSTFWNRMTGELIANADTDGPIYYKLSL